MPDNVVPFAPRPRRTARRRPARPAGVPLAGLINSWKLALQAANKSPNTITMYTRVAGRFVDFLETQGLPDDAERVTAEEVRAFLVAEQQRAGIPTAASAHAYLGVWFTWIIAEEERTTFSPVLKADRPKQHTKAAAYLTTDQVAALLGVCKGPGFAERRDTAIIRTFHDNGMRVSGLVGTRLDDVDLPGRRLRIVLKGGKERWAPIGDRTAQAIDRYLRLRARHPAAALPWLWLAVKHRHRLGVAGVQDMLKRRGEQAGIEGVHPHRFRSTSAHEMLAAGMSTDAVRRVLGWESDAMLRHYTEELADERAREAHARFSPSDRV